MSDKVKAIIVDMALGLLVIGLVWYLNADQDYTLVHRLCDGCYVAAVVLLGSAGLAFCRNKGALDIFGYGAVSLISMFNPGNRMARPEEGYYEYCQRKAGERKPFGHMLISGLVYLAFALIFMAMYTMAA